MARPIYVELRINVPMQKLWRLTQTPELHERWDLRFSSIRYLPRPDPSRPQRFLYETCIGFGLRIVGEGKTAGGLRSNGSTTSALTFWSDDPKSLIREGSGYWQYVQTTDGIRFLTSYDYRSRFGIVGRVVDSLAFRPLLGWATAWSFDRLRLWLERGVDPALSGSRALVHAICRTSLGAIWIYHGAVPKLIMRHEGELAMLRAARIWPGHEEELVWVFGVGEILLGLAFLFLWRARWPFWAAIGALLILGTGAFITAPAEFVAPFNPLTLTLALLALAGIGLSVAHDLPSARRCRRDKPPEG